MEYIKRLRERARHYALTHEYIPDPPPDRRPFAGQMDIFGGEYPIGET